MIGGEEWQLRIYRWRNDLYQWEKVPGVQSVNQTENTVTATLDTLTTSQMYAVGVDSSVTPFLNSYGTFTDASDLLHWFFELYADGTDKGTLTWVSDYNGQSGVAQIAQNAGEKGKITQVFSVPSTGWYTAIAKVATDIADVNKQQKVYLYLQELSSSDNAIAATGNIIIQPGKGGFGGVGIWRELKISFYASNTLLGVQVVGINPITTGDLYIDEVWVTAGASLPSGTVTLTNPDFTSDISGWLTEIYGDGTGTGTWTWVSNQDGCSGVMSGTQSAGQKAKHSQIVNLPFAGRDALGSVWVYSSAGSMNDTQKVYLYIYSYDNSGYSTIQETGNAILQPGKWTPGQWTQLQFGYTPLTAYNVVQLVGINPIGNPYQAIYFDDVEIKQ